MKLVIAAELGGGAIPNWGCVSKHNVQVRRAGHVARYIRVKNFPELLIGVIMVPKHLPVPWAGRVGSDGPAASVSLQSNSQMVLERLTASGSQICKAVGAD